MTAFTMQITLLFKQKISEHWDEIIGGFVRSPLERHFPKALMVRFKKHYISKKFTVYISILKSLKVSATQGQVEHYSVI